MTDKPLPRISHDARPFWDGCATGELRAQHCARCGGVQLPPRARCLECGALDLSWRAVPARGEVHSFTVVHRAPLAAFRADAPYVLALVDVAGRVRLMLNVEGCDPESVRIGMPVRIGFSPRGDGEDRVWLPVAYPQASP